MRLHVDPAKCQGHNRCVITVPELVAIDELGYSHELGDGRVPAALADAAHLAARNCPERAITLTLTEEDGPPAAGGRDER